MTLLATGIAFLVSALSLFAIRPLLRLIGALDVPNERSSHIVATLRGAGLGPLLGIVAGLSTILMGLVGRTLPIMAIGLASLVLGGLGFVEDTVGVPIRVRAFLQVVVGALASAAFVFATSASPLWIIAGALITAAYVNATNFMDGINGISGLHGIVVGVAYAALGLMVGSDALVAVSLVLAASFAAFLPWNLGRGRVFLGDAGSYLLGGVVSATAIWALLLGAPVLAVVGPVAIYLADTGFTLAKRIAKGELWYVAHRSHVYQRLVDGGLPHLAVAVIVSAYTGAAAAWGFLAVLGWGGALIGLLGIAATCTAYLSMPRIVLPQADAAATPVQVAEDSTIPGTSSWGDLEKSVSLRRWVVVGSSGFVGQSVCRFLREAGASPIELAAPRVRLDPSAKAMEVVQTAQRLVTDGDDLVERLRGCHVVVNAAGMAAPDSFPSSELFGANSLLPVVLAEAASRANVQRLIQVSSAAVQGTRPALDESAEVEPFSPYSASKALGERALAQWRDEKESSCEVVILRAASVQGHGRKTTESLRRIARTQIASVAAPGTQHTPVTSVDALAAFVALVGTEDGPIPDIVLQPWEGMTTRSVLEAAGHRSPHVLPAWLCRFAIAVGYALSRMLRGRLSGAVRRVELMWFGQAQHATWAESAHVEIPRYVADILAGTGGNCTKEDAS